MLRRFGFQRRASVHGDEWDEDRLLDDAVEFEMAQRLLRKNRARRKHPPEDPEPPDDPPQEREKE